MVFLGGSLYSLDMLPPFWQTISYFNPVVYLIDGLRFSFYGVSDFDIWISISSMVFFLIICITLVSILLIKGYNINSCLLYTSDAAVVILGLNLGGFGFSSKQT